MTFLFKSALVGDADKEWFEMILTSTLDEVGVDGTLVGSLDEVLGTKQDAGTSLDTTLDWTHTQRLRNFRGGC